MNSGVSVWQGHLGLFSSRARRPGYFCLGVTFLVVLGTSFEETTFAKAKATQIPLAITNKAPRTIRIYISIAMIYSHIPKLQDSVLPALPVQYNAR